MLAQPEFPEWLPSAVYFEAQRILNSKGADEALALRLATDRRMETVWPELEKHQKECELSDWAILMTGRVDVPPPDTSDPLVLFFWYAYTIAWLEPKIGTVSRHDLPIAQYLMEAARLRVSAANLRKLNLQYGAQIDVQDTFIDLHAHSIEEAAKFCNEIVDVYTKLKAAEAPLVVERNFGSREARAYVGMLAAETRNLFGQLLAGTLAKVASVALMKEITAAQVHNWARSGAPITSEPREPKL
jgi:hypothetical protein